jgi:hypothetical protein
MTKPLFAEVERIADAVMYEGYVLYPYRASAMKNRLRWQFGVVAPRDYSEAAGTDAWHAQTECVIEPIGDPRLTVRMRGLQLQRRTIEQAADSCEWHACERVVVDGRELSTWDEAVPQEVTVPGLSIDDLCTTEHIRTINLPRFVDNEVVLDSRGEPAARITRQRFPIAATIRISAERKGAFVKVRVRIENTTVTTPEVSALDRGAALCRSLVGCHTLLHVEDGQFVSMTDPSEQALAVAGSCVNEHAWPVLAGAPGARQLMLSSPIILYDYPTIAPESSGDFFDATEIDDMLALRVMTMTDVEKQEAAATDERASRIVERAGNTPSADLARLHGAIRSFEEMLNPAGSSPEQAAIQVATALVTRGSRVRLAPRKRADSMDMFLAGRAATVAAVHRDLEDRVFIAVTIDEDPGADLHHAYGRFFYFTPEEIVPLDKEYEAVGDR